VPNKAVEMKTSHFVVGEQGEEEWGVVFFNSKEEAKDGKESRAEGRESN
jgi:hypothetical protein